MGCKLTYEEQYFNILKTIKNHGEDVADRTGTGCLSIFGASLCVDLNEGFPLLTTKKMFYKNIFGELLWFLSGKTDLKSLREYQNKKEGVHTIWSDDFNKYKQSSCLDTSDEDLGRIYGFQLRNTYHLDVDYGVVLHDQLKTLVENIKSVKEDENHPMARRLICSFWNPYDHTIGDKKWAALPACHTDFQCIIRNGTLNLRFSMRSSDTFLGLPYNVASYALLCHILAKLCGLKVGKVLYFGTDVHLYKNHMSQVEDQLNRLPSKLPTLLLPEFNNLEDVLVLTGQDFILEGYNPQGFLRAKQAS